MIKKSMTIQLQSGLEARPVALLVQVASQFRSEIYLEVGNQKRVNAKSIMGMMTMALKTGETMVVEAIGADEAAAIEGIEKYISGQEA